MLSGGQVERCSDIQNIDTALLSDYCHGGSDNSLHHGLPFVGNMNIEDIKLTPVTNMISSGVSSPLSTTPLHSLPSFASSVSSRLSTDVKSSDDSNSDGKRVKKRVCISERDNIIFKHHLELPFDHPDLTPSVKADSQTSLDELTTDLPDSIEAISNRIEKCLCTVSLEGSNTSNSKVNKYIESVIVEGQAYKGFCPLRNPSVFKPFPKPLRKVPKIPRIPYNNIEPKVFYDTFVKTRTPCVLYFANTSANDTSSSSNVNPSQNSDPAIGHVPKIDDFTESPSAAGSLSTKEMALDEGEGCNNNVGSPKGTADCANPFNVMVTKWTDDKYLLDAVGETLLVDVEYRNQNKGEEYGEGRRQQLPFNEFIRRVSSGDESVYLTTQKLGKSGGKDGPADLCGKFIYQTSLIDDIPLSPLPPIFGNLIPHQYNIWMGTSRDGTSTGLHHDYHDNFYVMIRGQKTFRLFSPRCAELLNTAGEIQKIHPNGLITYTSGVRDDGADLVSVNQWRVQQSEKEVNLLTGHINRIQSTLKALELCLPKASELDASPVNGVSKSKTTNRRKKRGWKKARMGEGSSGCNKGDGNLGFKKRVVDKDLIEGHLRLQTDALKQMQEYVTKAKQRLEERMDSLSESLLEKVLMDEEEEDDFEKLGLGREEVSPRSVEENCGNVSRIMNETNLEVSMKVDKTTSTNSSNTKRNGNKRSEFDKVGNFLPSPSRENDTTLSNGSSSDSIASNDNEMGNPDMIHEIDIDNLLSMYLDAEGDEECCSFDEEKVSEFEEYPEGHTPPHFCRLNTFVGDQRQISVNCRSGANIQGFKLEQKKEKCALRDDFGKEFQNISQKKTELVLEKDVTDREMDLGTLEAKVPSDIATDYMEKAIINPSLLGHYVEVSVMPGDILYLPASWFHEVISTSTNLSHPAFNHTSSHSNTEAGSNSSSPLVETTSNGPGHMAFNIWVYPPSSEGSFETPYEDEFWGSMYKRATAVLEKFQQMRMVKQQLIAQYGSVEKLKAYICTQLLGFASSNGAMNLIDSNCVAHKPIVDKSSENIGVEKKKKKKKKNRKSTKEKTSFLDPFPNSTAETEEPNSFSQNAVQQEFCTSNADQLQSTQAEDHLPADRLLVKPTPELCTPQSSNCSSCCTSGGCKHTTVLAYQKHLTLRSRTQTITNYYSQSKKGNQSKKEAGWIADLQPCSGQNNS